MTPEVKNAVEELERAFVGHRIDIEPEEQGGAYVTVHDVALGECYTPPTTWVGFLISFQYPFADCYPHFIDTGVARKDGTAHGTGFGATVWRNRAVWQISRRSNRLDPNVDTAASKLGKVIAWLRSQ